MTGDWLWIRRGTSRNYEEVVRVASERHEIGDATRNVDLGPLFYPMGGLITVDPVQIAINGKSYPILYYLLDDI